MTKSKSDEQPAEESVTVNPGQSIDEAVNAVSFDDAVGGSPDFSADEIMGDEAPAGTTDLSLYTSDPTFDRTEISLPRLRLAQGQTPEVTAGEAKPGQWVILGEEPSDSVVFIPLMFNREYTHTDEDGRIILTCTDALCPGRLWTDDPKTGKRLKPWCIRIYQYLGYSVDHGSLVELHLKRSGEEAARYINTFIATKKLGNFAIRLGSKAKSGPRNTSFFNPTVQLVQLDRSEMAAARLALQPG